MNQEHEDHSIDDGLQGTAHEVGKVAFVVLVARQLVTHRSNHVVERPSRYYNIVTGNEEGHEHALDAPKAPPRAGSKLAEGTDGVGMGVTPDNELAEHNRHTDEKDATQVYQDEGRSAVVSHLGGEAPHVAQPHGRACSRKDYTKFTTKIISLRH